MKFMFFSIEYRYSDILLKKHKLHLSCLFCCNHTCYCVNMVSVTSVSCYLTSASHYHPRYQSRSSMYIRGLIPRNFAELAEAVPIACDACAHKVWNQKVDLDQRQAWITSHECTFNKGIYTCLYTISAKISS